MRVRRPLLGLVLALPGAVSGGDEGREDAPVLLPRRVITAPLEEGPDAGRAGSFAVLPGATVVGGERDWGGRSLATLAEALRGVPGVLLQESFGGFEPPRLSIRGSGLDSAPTARGVALLMDGLPFTRADGSFHSGLFDPLLFSRVEVGRGTLYAGLAPAALGGGLDAVAVADGDEWDVEAGDWQALRVRFAGRAAGDAAGVQIAGAAAGQDGYRAHSAQRRAAAHGRIEHRLSAATTAAWSFYLGQAGYEVPGPLTLAQAMAAPRSVAAAVTRDQPRRDSTLARLGFQMESRRPAGLVTAGLAVQRLGDDFRQLQGNGESVSTSDDLSGQVTLVRRLDLGGTEHELLVRGTGVFGRNKVDRYLNVAGERGAEFAAVGLRAATLALSGEDIIRLGPDLAVSAGATVLRAGREIEDRGGSGGGSALARRLHFTEVSPRAGVFWRPQAGLTLFAAVSRGVEPPGFDDLLGVAGSYPDLTLNSRALAAQRAVTVETGARWQRGPVSGEVTVYRGWWRDEILRLAGADGLPRGAVNAARTIHEGVESSLCWRLRDGPARLTLGVTASWNDFHFEADPVYGRNRIAGAPPHAGNAELLCEHPRGWFVAGGADWVAGRTPVDHANRLGYGGWAVFGARAGWHWNKHLTVYAAVRNLSGRRYIASTAGVLDVARAPAATAIFLPGTGRGFAAGLHCHW